MKKNWQKCKQKYEKNKKNQQTGCNTYAVPTTAPTSMPTPPTPAPTGDAYGLSFVCFFACVESKMVVVGACATSHYFLTEIRTLLCIKMRKNIKKKN